MTTTHTEADSTTLCPYAARLEAWLSAHLDTTWPPVDADRAAALVRALSDDVAAVLL